MKRTTALFLILIIIIFSTIVIAPSTANESLYFQTESVTEEPDNVLEKGKNNFTAPETFRPIYVRDLVKYYPEIEVVSYKQNNKTIGFVNIMNGIGENFVIMPNNEYEIITKQNVTIQIT